MDMEKVGRAVKLKIQLDAMTKKLEALKRTMTVEESSEYFKRIKREY